MAFTVGSLRKGNAGSLRIHTGTLTFDSSYPAGGEPLTAAELGMHTVENLKLDPPFATVDTQVNNLAVAYDYTNAKVLAFEIGVRASGTAAADTTNFIFAETLTGADSAVKLGGPAVAINTNYGFGGLKEVADTSDLSAFVIRFVAIGT